MAAKLKDVEELSSIVTRVLGQNPGPYTLQGTNTYLIGTKGSSAILLDTGEDKPEYIPLLEQALNSFSGVSDIILSHYHHDHVLGLKSVLPLLQEMKLGKPKIHKRLSKEHDASLLEILASFPNTFTPASGSSPVHDILSGQTFSVEGGSLQVLSTPGHTDDSASFLLSSAEETVLFTADTVLGEGTAVFTDLKALISSLEECISAVKDASDGKVRLFCGHGPVVEDGAAKMQEYIDHRMQRERQVLEALEKVAKPTAAKEWVAYIKMIYGPKLPEKLLMAAEHGIVLHLEKLEQEGKVKRIEQGAQTLWELVPRTTKV